MKAQRQFSNGFSLFVTYTYASLLTTSESQHQYLDATGGSQNSYNYSGEETPSASLPPQVLNVAYVYELPFGRGKKFGPHSGAANAVFGGWRVSAIQRYQSGTPIAIGLGETPTQPGPLFNNAFRPDFTGLPIKAQWVGKFNPYTDVYLNPAAFSIPAPFTLGNVPRTLGSVRTFAWYNEDVSLAKEFKIGERFNFTLQGSAFNIFNRTLFGGPDGGNPGTNSDYGHINSQANSARVLQISGDLKF